MDIVVIEQALTEWVANFLGLNLDVNVFRGSIPECAEEGVAVFINDEVNSDSYCSLRTYNVQILAKYKSRDSAMRLVSTVGGVIPCNDIISKGIKFRQISPKGNGVVYSAGDDGAVKYHASINLLAMVLTNGSQVTVK